MKGDTFSFANLSVNETNNGGDGASPGAGSCSSSDIIDNNVQDIAKELDSVAVDWKSLRSVTVCPCSTPFDQFNRKVSKKTLKKIIKNQNFLLKNVFSDSLLAMW